jgi:hypothetical protein
MSRYFQYAYMNLTEIAEFHNIDIEQAELIVDGDYERARGEHSDVVAEKPQSENG